MSEGGHVLRLVEERAGVWCVSEVIRGFPPGSWAKFSSETVARNFMRWLQPLDTEGLIRRLITGGWTDADKHLYTLINTRASHAARIDLTGGTGTYWQRHYPELRF